MFVTVFNTGANQRMWALHKLRKLMAANFGSLININALLSSPTTDSPEEVPRPYPLVTCQQSIVNFCCNVSLKFL